MICKKSVATEVHEIERRSHAPMRWACRSNYLFVCQHCHSTKLDTMPHAEQLAYKAMMDPECYDLEKWLRIRDPGLRAPERVTQEEVDRFLVVLREGV